MFFEKPSGVIKMFITLECSVYPNITMFGNVTNKLIVNTGHSGTIPGAVDADGVRTALEKMVSAVREEIQAEEKRTDITLQDDEDSYVSINKRTCSLIELTRTASGESIPVMCYQYTDRI
jgi:hypothetical protein